MRLGSPVSELEDVPAPAAEVPERQGSRLRQVVGLAGMSLLSVPWIGVLVGIVVLGAVFNSICAVSLLPTSGNLLTTAQEFSYVGIAALGGRW